MGNGERVWMLVKLPSRLHVIGDDVADKYLLLANDHRGTGSVQVKFTPVRVVCNNTLTLALRGGSLIRVSHWRNARERLEAAKDKLGIINSQFSAIEQSYQAMLTVPMNSDLLARYLSAVFPEPPKATKRQKERVANERAFAEHFFAEGTGNRARGVAGTLWAAFNGVTELIDHRQLPNVSAQRRLQSIWFGTGASAKSRAYELAIYLTKNRKLPDILAPDRQAGDQAGKKRGFLSWRPWAAN